MIFWKILFFVKSVTVEDETSVGKEAEAGGTVLK